MAERPTCSTIRTPLRFGHSSRTKNAQDVYSPVPVLLRQETPKHVRFLLGSPLRSPRKLLVADFKRLVKRVGYVGKVGPNMARALDSDVADAVLRSWKTAKQKL